MRIPKNPRILMLDFPVVPRFLYDKEVLKIIKVKKAAQALLDNRSGVLKTKRKLKKSFTTGLLTIGNYLRKNGYQVAYDSIHSVLTNEQCQKISGADIILLTAMTPVYPYVRKIAREVKRIGKEKLVILGGYHASALPGEVLAEEKNIDVVVIGEGEKSLLNLLSQDDIFPGLPGVAVRDGRKINIGFNGEQLLSTEIPQPDYSLLPGDPQSYRYNIQTVRGCPNRCNYCVNGYFWRTVRKRPIESVIKELQYIEGVLGEGEEIHITDNILTLNPAWLKELVDAYEDSGLSLKFTGDIRAEFIDKERIDLMKCLGVKKVYIGFEDAEDSVTNFVNRKVTSAKNIEAIEQIKKYSDIKVEAYWMIGLPGTNDKVMEKNIALVTQLVQNDLLQSVCFDTIFVPLPGTPLFDEAGKFGIKILNKRWENYHRTQYWPVYEYEFIDRVRLRKYFLDFERAVTKAYLNKLGLTAGEAIDQYNNLLSLIAGAS